MRPADSESHVRALHASYESRTGYPIRWNLHRLNQWSHWCGWANWEWTDKELAIVIAYLRAEIGRGKRNDGSLKFDNLIGQPDRFEEDLNLALEARRSSPATPRPSTQPAPPPAANDEFESAEDRARHFREIFRLP